MEGAPERFPEMLENTPASILIDIISAAYFKNFQDIVSRFQDTSDPAEANRLWGQIDEALFDASTFDWEALPRMCANQCG